jgi:hypothetical protein
LSDRFEFVYLLTTTETVGNDDFLQFTGWHALHVAEVPELALRHGRGGRAGPMKNTNGRTKEQHIRRAKRPSAR